MKKLRIGSLFSGIGGIDLGFQQAGFEIAFAIETDREACKTYRANFKDGNLIEADIRNVDSKSLMKVDVLTAGFPCQPFSVCGKQRGFADQRGNLFFEIMRIVDSLDCPAIFLENVANLTKHDHGQTFKVICDELKSRGYYFKYLIADACNYGIPQHRTRAYIVAFKAQTAAAAFEFPPCCKLTKHIFDLIDRKIKVADCYYLAADDVRRTKLEEVMSDPERLYRFADYGIQASEAGISFTLKANMGTWSERVPYLRDNFGIRKITPQECLALQGFPKEYTFPAIPLANAYKQCGNTVCVPLIKQIAEKIKAVLNR